MPRKTKKGPANYDPTHLPARLRELRLAQRVSQSLLARRSLVPQATLSAIELGTMPRWDVALQLAAALGVTLDELAAPPAGLDVRPIGTAELWGKIPPEAGPRPEKPRRKPRKPRAPATPDGGPPG